MNGECGHLKVVRLGRNSISSSIERGNKICVENSLELVVYPSMSYAKYLKQYILDLYNDSILKTSKMLYFSSKNTQNYYFYCKERKVFTISFSYLTVGLT